jgi:ribosome maturation factor RimP
LEVSSPGINRPLKNEAHFQNFIGEKVKVTLFYPLTQDGRQKNFSGLLVACRDQAVEIEDLVSGRVRIPISAIAKANLDLI